MRFRGRDLDSDTDINLTPLIDVVFLLLIFFMVTTTFSKEAQIKLQLPEATSSEKVDPSEKFLMIQIDDLGQYAVKGADDESPRELINTSHDTLRKTIQRAARNMVDPVVLIRADRKTPHEAVVKAMDAARNQGLFQITFSTDTN
ncbi:MAG: biopolymer transporter ExbD [Pseudomonadota bacterium]